MQTLLQELTPADYQFLAGILESPLNLSDDAHLKQLIAQLESEDTPAVRAALAAQLESTLRYLGSSELLYWVRAATSQTPGVVFREIIRDVAKALKVQLPPTLATDRDQLRALVEEYATQQFSHLTRAEQQQLLEDLGVEREKALSFLKKSAGVFALPALIEAFNLVIVEGLIKRIIFGTIAKLIGSQLAGQLFRFIAGRFPWWVSWIGPAAWTISIGWATLDLQGPALRKTIPAMLYLGLCVIRIDGTTSQG